MALPEGAVAFLFSDIEGSTRLWENDPTGMRESLAEHDAIVRRAVEAAGGQVFKHTGDGFAAAFSRASAGAEAALASARQLATHHWAGPELRCRFGLHVGDATPTGDDYFGPTINRSARIMDAGNGGQIVVSQSARTIIANDLPTESSIIDLGEHRLKDLGEPVGLYRLVGPGAEDDRPLRTLQASPHNLPVQLTSFVGRSDQINEIVDHLREARLVTLTGIGGIGKTRLALQVGGDLVGEFAGGVWLVDLGSLSDADLVWGALADAMPVTVDDDTSAREWTLVYVADREVLLVVDNCEHLIDEVAAVVHEVLRASPGLRVLATSREGLGVPGEAVWPVPALDAHSDGAAVELFADRARLVRPDFTVSDANRAQVAELCGRLDGLPLAIELATARLKMLRLDQIVEQLSDRFRLLTGGSRTAEERHRTLLGMMDWSYRLIPSGEQALLRHLAVFVDGFVYDAAEQAGRDESGRLVDVLDGLGHLVEASLVRFEAEPGPRYRLLETVRQYGLDRLVEAGEDDDARLRHAEHFARAAERAAAVANAGDLLEWQLDLANYRAAMAWAYETGRVELAFATAVSLRPLFLERSASAEALRWILMGLDSVDGGSPLAARGLAYALVDAFNVDDGDLVAELSGRVRTLLPRTSDPSLRGLLNNALAMNVMLTDLAEGESLLAAAQAALLEAGDPAWTTPMLNRTIARSWMGKGLGADLLEVIDASAEKWHPERVMAWHAQEAASAGRYKEACDLASDVGPTDPWAFDVAMIVRVHALRALGRPEEALALEMLVGSLEERGDANIEFEFGLQFALAHLELSPADIDAAEAAFFEGYRIGSPLGQAAWSWFWSLIAERRGHAEEAAMLAGFAEHLGTATAYSPRPFDVAMAGRSRGRLREQLGNERYGELHTQGQRSSFEEIPKRSFGG